MRIIFVSRETRKEIRRVYSDIIPRIGEIVPMNGRLINDPERFEVILVHYEYFDDKLSDVEIWVTKI